MFDMAVTMFSQSPEFAASSFHTAFVKSSVDTSSVRS
jgi:hypothetical protein